MILIDTSSWIEFFRKQGRADIKSRIASFIELEMAAYTCPVLFELLAGASGKESLDIKTVFSFCHRINFSPEHWEYSAELKNLCRQKGLTIPNDDIFVCAVALKSNIRLFHLDRHFELFMEKTKLPLKFEA
ncbi:MAG TPA: hypothetical protein DCZ94_15085 [Lentisphaeria bacterium]|nr:MAG: hypothetical protein A2X48_03240 [Lentisphaerae bacterium GWF2_49_21]HBC88274.1 hypothetical protein [Lentisphaeria bacterium]